MKKGLYFLTFSLVLIAICWGTKIAIADKEKITPQDAYSSSGVLNLAPEGQLVHIINVSDGERLLITWNSGSSGLNSALLWWDFPIKVAPSGTYSEIIQAGTGGYTNLNITLYNGNAQAINDGTYSVTVSTFSTTTGDIPPMGLGIMIMIAWPVIAGLSLFSGRFSNKKIAPILLIANVGMLITWYGGIALAELPWVNGQTSFLHPEFDGLQTFQGQMFEVGENEGIIIYASINFQYEDPISASVDATFYDASGGSFGVSVVLSSSFVEYESDSTLVNVPQGRYLLWVESSGVDLSRFTIQIKKAGMFADISPIYLGEGLHIAFLSFGVVGIIVSTVAIIKNVKNKS